MRLKSLLVLVFVAAMLFALGGNASPPQQQIPGNVGDITHLPTPLPISFMGKVLSVKAGKVFSAGQKDAPSNWLCIAFVEVHECMVAEPICGVSTQWVYVTKNSPLEATTLCAMLSQATVNRDGVRVEGVCTSVPATEWCELTSLEVSGIPAKPSPGSGLSDEGKTYQPGDHDDEASDEDEAGNP